MMEPCQSEGAWQTYITVKTVLNTLAAILGLSLAVSAASTVDAANRYAYGANIGWVDFRADTNNGAVLGEYVCSGYIYSANVGWINLGGGSPVNGIQYQNNAANDFGVNQDGLGNLRGFAYGANIGWINFENTGAPRIDLKTGNLSGFVYGANVGWISLSNAVAYVQTDTIARGIVSGTNGLPDAWQYQYFGHLGVDPNADPDGDGMSNLQEYLAGTDPTLTADVLKITLYSATAASPNMVNQFTWTSHPTRCYTIQERQDLNPLTPWLDSGLGLLSPDAGGTTARTLVESAANMYFYRIQAVRPLLGP